MLIFNIILSCINSGDLALTSVNDNPIPNLLPSNEFAIEEGQINRDPFIAFGESIRYIAEFDYRSNTFINQKTLPEITSNLLSVTVSPDKNYYFVDGVEDMHVYREFDDLSLEKRYVEELYSSTSSSCYKHKNYHIRFPSDNRHLFFNFYCYSSSDRYYGLSLNMDDTATLKEKSSRIGGGSSFSSLTSNVISIDDKIILIAGSTWVIPKSSSDTSLSIGETFDLQTEVFRYVEPRYIDPDEYAWLDSWQFTFFDNKNEILSDISTRRYRTSTSSSSGSNSLYFDNSRQRSINKENDIFTIMWLFPATSSNPKTIYQSAELQLVRSKYNPLNRRVTFQEQIRVDEDPFLNSSNDLDFHNNWLKINHRKDSMVAYRDKDYDLLLISYVDPSLDIYFKAYDFSSGSLQELEPATKIGTMVRSYAIPPRIAAIKNGRGIDILVSYKQSTSASSKNSRIAKFRIEDNKVETTTTTTTSTSTTTTDTGTEQETTSIPLTTSTTYTSTSSTEAPKEVIASSSSDVGMNAGLSAGIGLIAGIVGAAIFNLKCWCKPRNNTVFDEPEKLEEKNTTPTFINPSFKTESERSFKPTDTFRETEDGFYDTANTGSRKSSTASQPSISRRRPPAVPPAEQPFNRRAEIARQDIYSNDDVITNGVPNAVPLPPRGVPGRSDNYILDTGTQNTWNSKNYEVSA